MNSKRKLIGVTSHALFSFFSSELPNNSRKMETDTPETDRHTGLRHDIRALCETSRRLERDRNELAKKFTKLDKPKYSGDPMLDSVLGMENADFRAWVASLPPTYWAKYDLSAARIGWEAGCKFILKNAK